MSKTETQERAEGAPAAELADVQQGEIESNWDQVVDKFDDMGLKEDLLRGILA